MGKYRGLDLEEGWIRRELTELKRAIQEQAAARRLGLQSEVRQVNLDPLALTSAWTGYGHTQVTPPDGYNVALVQMLATAGVSWANNTGGNVGVQPVAGGVAGIGQSDGRAANGIGGGAGLSVTTSLAARLTVTPGVPFTIYVNAYANDGYTAGTGNARFSATIIYTRE
jgi:hypothetical protein